MNCLTNQDLDWDSIISAIRASVLSDKVVAYSFYRRTYNQILPITFMYQVKVKC